MHGVFSEYKMPSQRGRHIKSDSLSKNTDSFFRSLGMDRDRVFCTVTTLYRGMKCEKTTATHAYTHTHTQTQRKKERDTSRSRSVD